MSDAVQRYQTVDLPVPKAHVIEWLRHCVTYPRCRHRTWASMKPIPATPFGPRVEAVVGLVTGVYHLSRHVAVSLMSDNLGISISLGAVSAVEARVSEARKRPVDEEARGRCARCGPAPLDGNPRSSSIAVSRVGPLLHPRR